MLAISRPDPDDFPATAIDIIPHITWARAIARGVRRDYRFRTGSPEEQELESTAFLALVKKSLSFTLGRVPPHGNVHDAFRGYASQYIRKECRREAIRLRNGGTYHTRRETDHEPLIALPLDLTDLSDTAIESPLDGEHLPPEAPVSDPPPIRAAYYPARPVTIRPRPKPRPKGSAKTRRPVLAG